MSSIYLTGDVIENPEYLGLSVEPDWRSLAMSKLQRYGMRVVNPIIGAWDGQTDDGIDRRVRRALDLIDQCDALLANLNQSSHGTAMEIFYAHRRGKVVTVVGQSPFSPWVLSHSQARFEDIDHALRFLIEEHPQPDLLNWTLQHEGQLSERYEQLPPPGEMDFHFLGGDLPVLLVAPHATAYFREGEFQEPDAFTGTMAAGIHKLSGCHTLLTNFCSVADPLWHVETPLVRALTDVVKAGQCGMVVVLVGSPWHESPGLFVEAHGLDGSGHEDLAGRLRLRLSAVEPVGTNNGDFQMKPLVSFVSEVLGLPCIVVKTHRRYRMPRLQPEPFLQVTNLIGEFMTECGVEFLRNRG